MHRIFQAFVWLSQALRSSKQRLLEENRQLRLENTRLGRLTLRQLASPRMPAWRCSFCQHVLKPTGDGVHVCAYPYPKEDSSRCSCDVCKQYEGRKCIAPFCTCPSSYCLPMDLRHKPICTASETCNCTHEKECGCFFCIKQRERNIIVLPAVGVVGSSTPKEK